ncbi:MAG: phytoene desaturase family protein [Verrucomicrobiota bacterium]
MSKDQRHVIVIGAGPGGLTSAMLLAHRGFRVTVVERESVVGGRSRELQLGDYSFDTGPTFLHQKFVLDEMFRETGRNSDDYLDFVKLDPMTRLSWGDTALNTYADRNKMAEEVERVFPGSRAGFERFMRDHAEKLQKIYPVLQKPFGSLASYLSPDLFKAFPYVATNNSVIDVLGKYFDDPRLQLAFTFQAKYLGMSPWRCPALFSILAFTEYEFGVYHTKGGLCKISQAMAKVLDEEGGEILFNSEVEEILTTGRKMTGVKLKDGSEIHGDEVIVNADFGHAMTNLLNGASVPDAEMRKKKFSCSTFMLYLGVDKKYDDEPFHHILFADDYENNVADIQSERMISDDMSIYIRNSSVLDPNVAPEGHSALYVLVPTINNRHGLNWDGIQQAYRDKVLDRIESCTSMTDLRDHIVEERIYTPASWQNDGVFMGATFNLSHHLGQMLYFRPHNRYQGFDNCFLVGGGTHPGSGLPTIYESARISTNLICDKHEVPYQNVDLASDYLNRAVAVSQ